MRPPKTIALLLVYGLLLSVRIGHSHLVVYMWKCPSHYVYNVCASRFADAYSRLRIIGLDTCSRSSFACQVTSLGGYASELLA
ncbi:hypothetical protein F4820DRAFT_404231 [Hypoxylon rubiginosum]|uniref:Uncharacterized protein n=1 Tax=Hypoxylon rubiginosum TaxID=110542 RepID=A0ACB9ZEK6_9PEZI|nr:hypothetical protein F4820DRAFT_404231 [Hypoxylon rubiginosum]